MAAERFDTPSPGGRFGFVQLEVGFPLGPADGRYLLRRAPGEEPELVAVLATLTAPAGRSVAVGRRRRGRRARGGEPGHLPISRAAVVQARPLGSQEEADAWLDALRRDREALAQELHRATRELDRLMQAHRAATGDHYARDLDPERALAVRVGHGTGQQVADGRFTAAYELPSGKRRARRIERIAPQEQLAALIGGREPLLASYELVLRARGDLDAGRLREAALQARIALECVLEELPGEEVEEALDAHRRPVSDAAGAALEGAVAEPSAVAVEEAVAAMQRVLRRRASSSS